jgi:hypothetical protein
MFTLNNSEHTWKISQKINKNQHAQWTCQKLEFWNLLKTILGNWSYETPFQSN